MDLADIELCRTWLKENAIRFFANDDFGKINGRIHHHAFANLKNPNIDLPKSWIYGAINIVKFRGGDVKAITNYIDKLVNHSFKDRTGKIIKSKII